MIRINGVVVQHVTLYSSSDERIEQDVNSLTATTLVSRQNHLCTCRFFSIDLL